MLDNMRAGALLVVELAAGKGTGRAPLGSHCVASPVTSSFETARCRLGIQTREKVAPNAKDAA
jgi:hypothetical protein